ncbi:hypothetical protein SPRG_19308 [Saprolegnia parasitica CBS 223.65]|uniref:PDZ domain-containing protein n=1 Tax=Saprolegnia parasitica (strain CBS 223.65) TaxID=695850 RepID=A0A067D3X2_SAPPC|nr:hypothetical protein SPRG_19308 [Saprolegnia parasitica CBS 223.65]KDO33697.1 hypothetical protein SPRG_19308 [Saprolegnia parasitica CBS 223.65]|eukprot:XP_012195720.1 hypothetical protein SPRG_19308 [Saprolegnia parasitica CBS 223.65]
MTATPLLPPVLTRLMRFTEGDLVKTPFGDGTFQRKLTHAPGRHVYVVALKRGGLLYAQTCWMMPRLPTLSGNEMPHGVHIETRSSGARGSILQYRVADKSYDVALEDGTTATFAAADLRLACRTRCQTQFGLGTVVAYRAASDSYVVQLDSNATAYIQAADVAALDLRLLEKIPKPFSAAQVLAEFNGRVSMEQAEAISAAGENAYLTLRAYCEKNAGALTSISTTFTYGREYSEALASCVNPEIQDAAGRVRAAGERELEKLTKLSELVKHRIEGQMTSNAELAALTDHSKKILQGIGNSIEMRRVAEELNKQLQASASSDDGRALIEHFKGLLQTRVEQQRRRLELLEPNTLLDNLEGTLSPRGLQTRATAFVQRVSGDMATLDPLELLAQVEELLPNVSKKAAGLLEDGEDLLARLQKSKQGQKLLEKAKELAHVSDDPDAIRDKVTQAVANVRVDDLAKWGRNLAVDRAARQAFVDQVKDHCLDFLMSVLPTIEVPPIVGTKDEIDYSISVLDLSNFHVPKEKVVVKLGTASDDEVLKMRASRISSLIPGLQWTFAQKYFPYLNGGGVADASVNGGCISLGFRAEKVLSIETGEYEPTLAVSSIEIEIKEELKLTVQGSWFSAVYNVLASLFKELIRDYIASTLEASLIEHVVTLVSALNKHIKSYWPLLLQVLHVTVDELPLASAWRGAKPLPPPLPHEDDIAFNMTNVPLVLTKRIRTRMATVTSVTVPPTASTTDRDALLSVPLHSTLVGINGLSCAKLTASEVRTLLTTLPAPMLLRFASPSPDDAFAQVAPRRKLRTYDVEFGPGSFGLKLRARPLAPLGVIVAGFIPDRTKDETKAMGAGELSGQIRPGNLLLKANGWDCRDKEFSEVMEHLKTLPRPWPPLVELDSRGDHVIVSGFTRLPSMARNSKQVAEGDTLVSINGRAVAKLPYDRIMTLLKEAMDAPPFDVAFGRKADKKVTSVQFAHGPMGILFGSDRDGSVFVKKFIPGFGPAERSGLVHKGFVLLQVGGKTVLDLDHAQSLLASAAPPYSLTVRDLDMEANIAQLN